MKKVETKMPLYLEFKISIVLGGILLPEKYRDLKAVAFAHVFD